MRDRVIKTILILVLALNFSGCAARPALLPGEERPMHTVDEFRDDEMVSRTPDPWEGFNRSMYKFNYEADRYVLLPVVGAYETAVPGFARTGVSNFFANLREIRTFYNCVLQAKGKKSLVTLGRFVTNATIGIGGLFDPATSLGMRRENEDFDHTLETWGVGTGPYLVLPILGPNTVRSATGFAADGAVRWAIANAADPFGGTGARTEIEAGTTGLETIDLRYRESFRYFESDYPFEYYMVRYLSSQQRELRTIR
ncbi:MlaA family lipoprotein [Geomesophilobacter sediminis]|uniref:VacJ family lipoprotein n=1 Tax=Geomesophilobacter sediminis TaxID=2798584 RepID=A0A8J7IQT6_9BACT|nr:VacJ family lipoprotein [Geomesophilobacter sediminis]MBJ6725089.1 VacJ family lipoprotein [Geomesophilobacter sediminis]